MILPCLRSQRGDSGSRIGYKATTSSGMVLICIAVRQSRKIKDVKVNHPVPTPHMLIEIGPTIHRFFGGISSIGNVYDPKHEKEKPITLPQSEKM